MWWRTRGVIGVLGLALGCSSGGDTNTVAGGRGGNGGAAGRAGASGVGGIASGGGGGETSGGTGGAGAAAGMGGGAAGSGEAGTSGAGGSAGAAGNEAAGRGGGGGTGGAAGGTGGGTAGASGAAGSAGGGASGVTGASGAPGGVGGGTAGASGAAGGGGMAGAAGVGGVSGGGGASGAAGGSAGSTAGRGGTGGNAAGAGGTAGSAGGPSCGSVARPATRLAPDILVVLDASGSMNEDVNNQSCGSGCGANSKWALMTAALTQVVSQTDTTVNWGLKMFAETGTCGVGNTPAVPIGASNAAAIAAAITGRTDAIGNVTNGSSTPTRRAEEAAVAYLSTLTDPNSKYILLATDGLPNCMPGSGSTATDDTAGAVAAVTSARLAGFPTFVVGISSSGGVADFALSSMAVEGGVPRSASPPYYPVTSSAELVATLNALVGVTARCEFSVPNPPTIDGTTSRADIWVTGDGTVIARDENHVNGWDYTSPAMTSIVLHGAACDAITAGTVQTITIVFRCRVV